MPPTVPDPTLDSAQEPFEGTPADEPEDTAAENEENTGDWESRYKELQSYTTRQIDQLRRQLESTTASDEDEEEESEDDEQAEPEPADRTNSRLERESWQLAEQVYGQGAIKAYNKAEVVFNRAQTPADYIAAFETYHQARLDGATRKVAREQAQGNEPSQPNRVDANRPDAGPRNDLNREAEEAFERGDSLGFFRAQVRKIRGE